MPRTPRFVSPTSIALLLPVLGLLPATPAHAQAVSGTQYDTVTLDFDGDAAFSETDGRADPNAAAGGVNPFLDRALDVTFTHAESGRTYTVPGFFDGDGAGGSTGQVFRARFTPDAPGQWTYQARLQSGRNVAIGEAGGGNVTGGSFTNGFTNGTLTVAPPPADAQGFHATGRLLYDADGTDLSKHYLRFQNGDRFLKGGTDSPENLLGYRGFDNTQTTGSGNLHSYAPHAGDYQGDGPSWNSPDVDIPNAPSGNDGANLIGAVNYLASHHVNSVYFLPMNIGGDGKDTHPFANISTPAQLSGDASNDNVHYDLSKLAQWEQIFSHAQDKGILLHVVLNEAEAKNKRELDNAQLGPERKLFYREMVARFGHHNALQWNISEEYNRDLDLGEARVKQFAQYISDLDTYDHPLTVHNGNFGGFGKGQPGASNVGQRNEVEPFLGNDNFDLTSYQNYDERGIGDEVEYFRARSRIKGRPIAVMVDEPESLNSLKSDGNFDRVRKEMIWDIYLSGGSAEWFVRDKDQTLEDFSEFEQVWDETYHARKFLEQNTPFWEMDSIILTPNDTPSPDDDYISADTLLRGEDSGLGGAEVFYKPGEVYAIYFPDGSNDDNTNAGGGDTSPELDLTGYADRTFTLRWYNPRTGEFVGESATLTGGGWTPLGATPDGFGNTNDWAALVRGDAVPEPATAAMLLPFLAAYLVARRP